MDCKKSNDLISVIVPVYNVERYLPKCLDSIISQTYKNLEIILINDGSTDNSGKICDEYLELDNRIIVIHKGNNGVSSARNYGLDVAKGKYVIFIDSDDWIEKNYVSSLYAYAAEDTIVCCGYKRVFEDKIIEHKTEKIYEYNKLEFLNMLQDYELLKHMKLSKNPIGNYLWNKIFPIYIFNNIKFPVAHTYEDVFVTIKLFNQINKFIIIPVAGYNYLVRNNSIVSVPEKFSYIDYILARMEQEQDFSFNNDLLLKARVLTIYSVIAHYSHYCNGYYKLNKSEIIKLKEIIKTRKYCIPVLHYKLLIKTFFILHAEIALKGIYKIKKLLK